MLKRFLMGGVIFLTLFVFLSVGPRVNAHDIFYSDYSGEINYIEVYDVFYPYFMGEIVSSTEQNYIGLTFEFEYSDFYSSSLLHQYDTQGEYVNSLDNSSIVWVPELNKFLTQTEYSLYGVGLADTSQYMAGYYTGYDAGVFFGREEGEFDGYNQGYIDGLAVADPGVYEDGYNDGFNAGLGVNDSDGAFEWLWGIVGGVGAILNLEVFPGFPIGLFILIPLMFGLLSWFIKMATKGHD